MKGKNNLQCSISKTKFCRNLQLVFPPLFSKFHRVFIFMISKKISAVFAVLILIFSTACVETVLVGGAATTTVVLREKTLNDTRQDVMIATKLGADFISHGLKNPGNSVNITVNEGRILLTGIVRNPEKGILAVQLAWKISEAKEVIDEIQVNSETNLHPSDFPKAFNDYILTLRIETALLFSSEISTVNYKVTTVAGTVYLIGVAANDDELQKVLGKVSKMRGVKKVVNYVILVNDSRRR